MIKYTILNSSLAVVSGTAALLISSCGTVAVPATTPVITINANEEAKNYNLALVDAIQNADRIVIKEHSHEVDFFGAIPGLDNPPQYSYGLKVLNTGEKILFLENARKLKGEARIVKTICLFVPHHTIDFYEKDVLKSSMQICYKCSDIKWSATTYGASQDVFQALTPLITQAGMQPHRAWDEMAKLRYKDENQVNRLRPDSLDGVPTAKWASGQKGKKVINPFTGKLVDVEGIPAKTKVRDPNDNDPSHIFRVPGM